MVRQVNRIEEESLSNKTIDKIKQVNYEVEDKKVDFDKEFAKGISRAELLKRVNAHIDSLPWKNL
jgi:hypothetical protein